jgi:hypothetical protein
MADRDESVDRAGGKPRDRDLDDDADRRTLVRWHARSGGDKRLEEWHTQALRRGLALCFIALCAAAATGLGTAAVRQPRLAITDPAPLTVRGSGFRVGERVTVTATVRVRRSRSAVADARGRFTVRFAGLNVENGCASYVIRALGDRGTRAAIKVTTVCAPPAAAPAELQPPDR